MKQIGLYIHIPFCEKKCHYCDFTSVPANRELIKKYEKYLIKELLIQAEKYGNHTISTIFIGGGTPSILDEKSIGNILRSIRESFAINPDAEISMEINPGTLTYEKAMGYKKAGINRVSMGIQSMNDNTLRLIGRIHNEHQVDSTVDILRKVGFDNINGDLIFGLPHQSVDDFHKTLDRVIELNLEHISMYGLILEEDTLLYHWYKKGLVTMPSEDEERQMYHSGIQILEQNGYRQYEISNLAKKGFECRHNLGYWMLNPYIGVGLSSHSSIDNRRYWNTSLFNEYFRMIDEDLLPISGEEIVTADLRESEYLILRIRLNEGISLIDYKTRFNQSFMHKYENIIEKHIESGLLKIIDDKIILTEKGKDLSNLVEVDFLP
ncbi:radical SAM family heme chaperone HemW [Gudongella sp. DL1XJH-153]|uniref:radical SAM family heme chaperone HemW n=1 Tax=Gudongella sp. DL1XJH-153 TaxID=3409804 RepID=UPI003BB75F2B